MRTTAAIRTAPQIEALPVTGDVRLGDVAQVVLGPEPGASILRANGETGIGIGIIRQANGNTLSISAEVRQVVADLQPLLPEDVKMFVTSDSAVFIDGAIHEVEIALGLSVLIVAAVIFLFLRDARATLIPLVAIPVALIGTLAAIWLVGFSVNILTLLALVLATGIVVDDAIVVLENIVRRRSEGMGARAAAVLGTQQVFFAVLATTTTLAAVFVPLSFLPGQTGGLFREFGFTLAISVLLSSVTALTLCPVLAARFLRAPDAARPRGRSVGADPALCRHPAHLPCCPAGRGNRRPAGGRPCRRQLSVSAAGTDPARGSRRDPDVGAGAARRVAGLYRRKMHQIEQLAAPLRASGEVTNVFAIAGMGGQDNRGFMVLTLAPWDQRARSQQEIADELQTSLGSVIGVRAFAFQTNSLGIRGPGGGCPLRWSAMITANWPKSPANWSKRWRPTPPGSGPPGL